MTPIDPAEMAQRTAEFFAQAAEDEQMSERLALAKTTVHIHYTDNDGVTLRLDRNPIEAEPRIVGDAEVEIWGSAEIFMDFTMRRKQMAMSIMRGELEYEGPVRKFLRIVPIMRSLDFGVWQGVEDDNGDGGHSDSEAPTTRQEPVDREDDGLL